ncbi:methionyl-tRNA formyltransferase [Frondihabitans australicus]|uniref:Methionyl-tRNA formyltransferase n=1 Tax=Frondihabitans australicus TaxID=386892 RepID=A0A495IFY0_9MICO|nr:methionyl-tRNA formyltransferase [Frondihabitans australicus]RKR74115.1 methionyl-tRNA formyltransferase [Frondihabitans australicus]
MRLVFAGSPAAAVPSLRALAASPDHEVAAVLTRDDTPQGRKRVLTPTPVADAAAELGIPVIKARRITDEVTSAIVETQADLGVIVAYGALLREPLLSTLRLGWINLHFSLLPRWRGAAPVQRALIAGDTETGAAVFQLVPELDAGVVHGQITKPLHGDETAGVLLGELAISGALLLSRVVDEIGAGTSTPVEQQGDVTLAPKLTLDDARLDPSQPAAAVYDRFRGVTPEPGAFVEVAGARLKLLAAKPAGPGTPAVPAGAFLLDGRRALLGAGGGALELVTVQPAGKKPMAAADWLRGVASRETLRVDDPAAEADGPAAPGTASATGAAS